LAAVIIRIFELGAWILPQIDKKLPPLALLSKGDQMATVHKEFEIAVTPETVWAAVKDVSKPQELFVGMLTDAHMDSEDTRTVTFVNGLILHERIITIDSAMKRFVYASVNGRTTHHSSSIQVLPTHDGNSKVVWITDFLPEEFTESIQQLMEQGAAAMKRTLEQVR
jgi:carbon monoxide dehydrogenase subunit G